MCQLEKDRRSTDPFAARVLPSSGNRCVDIGETRYKKKYEEHGKTVATFSWSVERQNAGQSLRQCAVLDHFFFAQCAVCSGPINHREGPRARFPRSKWFYCSSMCPFQPEHFNSPNSVERRDALRRHVFASSVRITAVTLKSSFVASAARNREIEETGNAYVCMCMCVYCACEWTRNRQASNVGETENESERETWRESCRHGKEKKTI